MPTNTYRSQKVTGEPSRLPASPKCGRDETTICSMEKGVLILKAAVKHSLDDLPR